MQLYRITFTVQDDEVSEVFIESTKGCPQCDEGATHDEPLDHGHGYEDEDEVEDEAVLAVVPTSSIKSGPAEADSDSRS